MAPRKKGSTGRGSIRQDKRGKWHVFFSPGNGAKRVHREAKTEAEVLAKLRELEQRKATGVTLGRAPTVTQWLNTWLDQHKQGTIKDDVLFEYRRDCRLYIEPYIGHIRLDQLTAPHVRQMLRDIESKGLSGFTTKKGYARLSAALDAAVSDGLIPFNVIKKAGIKAPRTAEVDEAVHALTDGQVARLLRVASLHRLYALFVLAVRTGMRQGEILGLRWIDIKWDAREIHVTGQLRHRRKQGDTPGALIRTTTKTKKSRRVIPVGPLLVRTLRAHQTNQAEERTFQEARNEWQDSGLVFVSSFGTPISASNLIRTFHQLRTQAELPRVRFHDLRHTFASLALAAGEPITDVSAILGHADSAITARIYAHSYDEAKRRTMERLEARQIEAEHEGSER